MDEFRSKTQERPVIVNHVRSSLLANRFPNLRQFILVEVGRSVVRGWLLAANRSLPGEQRKNYRVSEEEFGTVEATLMQSAAASLATHFHNVELLTQKENLFTEGASLISRSQAARL
jgi:hypothetical protein